MRATEVVDLAATVGAPAETLVESATLRVLLEHPQEQLVDIGRCPEAIDGRHQLRADASPPRRRIDVDGVHLGTPLGGLHQVVVPYRTGVSEAAKRIGFIKGDEGRRLRPGRRTDP